MKVIYKIIPITLLQQPLFYCIVSVICILCNRIDRMAAGKCRLSHRIDCFIFSLWIPTVALLNVPSLELFALISTAFLFRGVSKAQHLAFFYV